MYKLLFLIVLILVFGIAAYIFYWAEPANFVSPLTSSTPENKLTPPTVYKFLEIKSQNKVYQVAWIKVDNPTSFNLYLNLPDQRSAEELKEEKHCNTLVNAGFYTKDKKPIGLFQTDGKLQSIFVQSKLFNGIFSLDKSASAHVSRTPPVGSILALQAGPILIYEGKVQDLGVLRDEEARRTAVALSQDNAVIFLSIFDKDSVYLGPKLSDLPLFVKRIEQELQIEFVSALNLDGGTASAFLSDGVSLSELSPIGSYFCIK